MPLVEFEVVDGHIAVLTLNRPRARNAINGAMAAAIEDALDRFEGDDELWVGVLCGRGKARPFAVGGDLPARLMLAWTILYDG